VLKPKVFSTDSYLACMTMVAISAQLLRYQLTGELTSPSFFP